MLGLSAPEMVCEAGLRGAVRVDRKAFPLGNSARKWDFSTCISVLVIPYFYRRWLVELDEDSLRVRLPVASVNVVSSFKTGYAI